MTVYFDKMKPELCRDFKEHEGWQQKHRRGPVTWDAHCSKCGFELQDRPFATGLTIEGNGRTLFRVYTEKLINGEWFSSKEQQVVCTKCVPNIVLK